MMQYRAIGANWASTAKEVGQPFSEWFVQDATEDMSVSMLQENAARLQDQLNFWNGNLVGANSKSTKNLNKIISLQSGKLAAYEQILNAKGAGTGPGIIPGDQQGNGGPLPPVTANKNWLPYAVGAGLLLMLFMRKK